MKFAYRQNGQKLQPFKVTSLNFPKKCSAGGEHTQTSPSAQNYTVNGITNCPEELLGAAGYIQLVSLLAEGQLAAAGYIQLVSLLAEGQLACSQLHSASQPAGQRPAGCPAILPDKS